MDKNNKDMKEKIAKLKEDNADMNSKIENLISENKRMEAIGLII